MKRNGLKENALSGAPFAPSNKGLVWLVCLLGRGESSCEVFSMCVLAATAAVCVCVPGFLHYMFFANQLLFLVSPLQKLARLIAGSIPVRTVVFFLFSL